MKSPFDFVDSGNNLIKTNNFDWTHVNNFSTSLGRITPIFCQLVPAHTGLSINPRLGLNFMPMVFPLQSRVNARVSFFKIPLRTLWKDYKDFVGNFREGLIEPYIDFKGHCPKTGSLYDYLGLPTTLAGAYGQSETFNWNLFSAHVSRPSVFTSLKGTDKWFSLDSPQPSSVFAPNTDSYISVDYLYGQVHNIGHPITDLFFTYPNVDSGQTVRDNQYIDGPSFYIMPVTNDGTIKDVYKSYVSTTPSTVHITFPYAVNSFILAFKPLNSSTGVYKVDPDSKYVTFETDIFLNGATQFAFSYGDDSSYQVHDIDENTSPYFDSSSSRKDKQLKVAAYSPRAYEAVYNAFFRYNRNNPFYVNGEVQYNQWLPSLEGGLDNYDYRLRYCNWEKDSFTTAVQSPQQGVAPLVGLTTYQETVTSEDGQTNVVNRVSLVDEDGRKFGVEFVSDEDGLKDVNYTRLAGDRAVSKPVSLIELAQSGISINDLRNVNAYQKFLELNMRQGYSYKEIVEGRFQVSVRYDDLQMPEFIGGFTEPVSFGAQSQTVQRADTGSYADQLGALAGTGGVRRDGSNISVFCDEESIILGLCVVVPTPIYTQVLPKHFLYRGLLDHFQPEFANIGFQPITYRELCPVQAFNENPDSLTETFGYNRPWYDMCQQLDTAHGLFRTQLRNFIMNRTFGIKPQLSESFLLVDPTQVNDVFAVTDVSDKIFGAVFIGCTAKLPLGRTAIPRLD